MIRKIKNIYIILIVTFLLVGSFIEVSTIHAEAGTGKGSIQIIYKGRDNEDKEVILSGARFSIFPIQYVKNDGFIWVSGFENAGVSLEGSSAEEREKQAKQLFEYVKKNNISGLTQETDVVGCTSFGNLDEGIYLLAQIGNVQSGTDKFESAPFLVNIPSEINGDVEYDVTIEPKAEWVLQETPPTNPDNPAKPVPQNPKPSKPDTPSSIQNIINIVKTGDMTSIIVLGLTVIVSLSLIIAVCRKKNNEKNTDRND